MQTLGVINDPIYTEKSSTNIFEKLCYKLLSDKRDLPFIYLTLKISLTIIPISILLFMPFVTGIVWWSLAVLHFYLNNFVYKGPFGLMFHCTTHRKFFKDKYRILNLYQPWVLAPFFGQAPQTYYTHHIWMHHRENNLENDGSSTMKYQRDSFTKGFLKYHFDFTSTGLITLATYLIGQNRKGLAIQTLLGEFLYIGACVGLSFVNFPATLVVLILPYLISRFIMMLGNFTQHAFVSSEDPGNPYKNSITCVNTKYNHKCWNDGYHVGHHIRPGMHWTEHPKYFLSTIDEYAKEKAIVFNGLGYLEVFWYLMNKNYEKLASHVVNINSAFSGKEEIISLMKMRTKKIV